MTTVRIRRAVPEDVPGIVGMIRDLADFERVPEAAKASEADLHRALFDGGDAPGGSPAAFCEVLVEESSAGEELRGMVLWFATFSTWEGKHGIYLEDLYVRPEARGHGYGRALLAHLAAICRQRGYARLEWSVLDWNKGAIGFYESQGATPRDGWTVYRVSGEALQSLGSGAGSSPMRTAATSTTR